MASLRKTWERVYRQAIELLKSKKNPIADYTLSVIENNILKIIPFNKMVQNDFNRYLNDYRHAKSEDLPKKFPPSKEVVKKFSNAWSAKISGNRVSIDNSLTDPKRIAEVLVHEANHFLNNSNDHYHTKEQRFAEEFRAETAEALVFSPYMTKARLRTIANHVADRFSLPHPKSVSMPDGLFVPKP